MAVTKKIQNSSISGTTLKDKPQGWEYGPGGKQRKLSDDEVAKFIKEADDMFGGLAGPAGTDKPAKKPPGKRALANAFSKELISQKFSGKPDPERLAGIVAQIRGLPDGKPTQAELDLVKSAMTESGITHEEALDTFADALQVGFDKAMDAVRDDPPIHASDMSKVYQDVDDKIALAMLDAGEAFSDAGLICMEEAEEAIDEKVKPIVDGLAEAKSRVDNLLRHVEQNGEYLDNFVEATQGDISDLSGDVAQLKHDVGLNRATATRAAETSARANDLFHQLDAALGRLSTDVTKLQGGFTAQLRRTNEIETDVRENLRAAIVDQEEMYGVIGEWQRKVDTLEQASQDADLNIVELWDKVSAVNTNITGLNERLFRLEAGVGTKPTADGLKNQDPWNFPRGPWVPPTNLESEREGERDAENALELAFEIKRLHQEIDSYARTRQDIVDNDDQFASLNGKRLVAACDQKISEMRTEIEELRGEFDTMVGGDIDIDADGLYAADQNQFEVDLRCGPNGPRALTRGEQRDILVNKLMGHAVYWSVHPKLEEETESEHRYRICSSTVASVLGTLDGDGDSGYLVIPTGSKRHASQIIENNENFTMRVPAIHEHHQLSQLDIAGDLKERAVEMTRSFRSTFRRKLTCKD